MWPFTKRVDRAEQKQDAKEKWKWPNCAPIDKSDTNWKFNNNLNCNGINYLKKEIEPGRWQWVENEEANQRQWEYQQRKRELFNALWTRTLTVDEEAEAMRHGDSLNIESMVPYHAGNKRRELQDAWSQQRRLQALERSVNANP